MIRAFNLIIMKKLYVLSLLTLFITLSCCIKPVKPDNGKYYNGDIYCMEIEDATDEEPRYQHFIVVKLPDGTYMYTHESFRNIHPDNISAENAVWVTRPEEPKFITDKATRIGDIVFPCEYVKK